MDADGTQHARLPQDADLALQPRIHVRLAPGLAFLQQRTDGGVAVQDGFAPDLGGMGGEHRRQQRLAQEGAGLGGIDAARHFFHLQRAGLPRFGAQHMVVGDVGELGEDGEGADQQQQVGFRHFGDALGQHRQVGAAAVIPDGLASHLLDQSQRGGAMLFADDFAQQAAQQADIGRAFEPGGSGGGSVHGWIITPAK